MDSCDLTATEKFISNDEMKTLSLDSNVVYVTVPNEVEGKAIASHLVQNRLAACVNIIPSVTSVYSWEGKVCEDTELLLIIKTQTPLLQQVMEAVKKLHSYTTPEFISLPITGGSLSYLQWISTSTKQ